MAEAGSSRNHQIALGEVFATQIGGEGAGNIEREWVAVKQTFSEQGSREQCAGFFCERLKGGFGSGPHRPAPADDNWPFGLGDHRDDLVHHRRIRPHQLVPRHQLGRWGIVGQIGKFLLLQIKRDAQHDRLPFRAGDVECLADAIECPIDRTDRHKMSARRQRQGGLVDRLQIPGCPDRSIASKHHNRRIAARRHHQRSHDLGVARAAGDRSDADLSGSPGIGIGHRDAAMLVARVDQARLLFVCHRG